MSTYERPAKGRPGLLENPNLGMTKVGFSGLTGLSMELVATDLLTDVCALSPTLLGMGLATGLLLWLLGWWSHRFWVVLSGTVLGGIYGLTYAAQFQTHPLASALLVAFTCGILALALVRVLAFFLGGLVGVSLVHSFMPAVQQPLLGFLIGGLVCLLLFRWGMVLLTSLAGSLLMVYCGLALLHQHQRLNAVAWVEQGPTLVNTLTGLLAFFGVIVQFVLDRGRRARLEGEKEREGDRKKKPSKGQEEKGWLGLRKAG